MQVPLTWPVRIQSDGSVPRVTSDFASHLARSKTPGVDIAYRDLRSGQDVGAVAAGVVLRTGTTGTGDFVVIDHPGGLQTVYRHMRDLAVAEGLSVVPGTLLGRMSFSPRDPEKIPHLHFELKHRGRFLDPEALLRLVRPTVEGAPAQLVDLSVLRARLAKARTLTTGNGALIWILILLALSHN